MPTLSQKIIDSSKTIKCTRKCVRKFENVLDLSLLKWRVFLARFLFLSYLIACEKNEWSVLFISQRALSNEPLIAQIAENEFSKFLKIWQSRQTAITFFCSPFLSRVGCSSRNLCAGEEVSHALCCTVRATFDRQCHFPRRCAIAPDLRGRIVGMRFENIVVEVVGTQ